MGGNWQEPSYWYNTRLYVSPWARTELVGFRCMRYINDTLKNELSQSFNWTERDFSKAKPVSDDIFDVYRNSFDYEKRELNPISISKSETEMWTQEIISVNVPYEETPLKIFIFIPKNFQYPYQSIIYFPGLGARQSNSLANLKVNRRIDFLLKSGRAVIYPVYYSTY